MQQWNTSVQYLLTNSTLVEVAYHGAKSAHLMSGLDYNETESLPASAAGLPLIYPYPQLGNVNITSRAPEPSYNALQARLERRFANGFTGLVSYTFQQTLTDLDASSVGVAFGAGAGLQTIKDIRANYGPALFDRPHRLVVNWLYAPAVFQAKARCVGKSRRRLADRGNWHIPGRPGSDAVLVWRPVRRIPRQSSRRPELCRAVSGRSIDGSTSASSRIQRQVSSVTPERSDSRQR